MSKYPWLRPSHLALLVATYAVFAIVAGGTTFFALLAADSSPYGLALFLAGAVTGAAFSVLVRLASTRHLLKRAFDVLPYPI